MFVFIGSLQNASVLNCFQLSAMVLIFHDSETGILAKVQNCNQGQKRIALVRFML